MTTLQSPIVGPPSGHPNRKAIVSVVLGSVSMICLVVFAVLLAVSPNRFDDTGWEWTLLPFVVLVGGMIAAFLGALAWIDVRRGITDRHLFEAQMGAILGGIAALAIVAALVVLAIVFVMLMVSFVGAD